MLTFESFVKKISDVLKKKIQKKFLDNRFNLTRKLYIRAFLFNSFMAEAPIIQKTVHWFAEQNRDLRYERVKPRLTWLVSLFNKTSEIAKSDISLQVILGRSLNTLSTRLLTPWYVIYLRQCSLKKWHSQLPFVEINKISIKLTILKIQTKFIFLEKYSFDKAIRKRN